MVDIEKLIRPHIKNLNPYSSARDEFSGKKGIFLDANENPLGSTAQKPYNRYPDPYQVALKKAISKVKEVEANQIFLGNGSDEAIDLLIRIFCNPRKDDIMVMPPTFEMYEVAAVINENPVTKVHLTRDFQIDLENVLKSITPFTKIIFICSPNNPTGNSMDNDKIENILSQFKGIVVIDEAYIDFSGNTSWIPSIQQYPNLVILQTFSKAWGMAGLRLGMAFSSDRIIELLNKVKSPYNINSATQKLAIKGLKKIEQKDYMVQKILAEREILARFLLKLSIVEEVYPSDANFLLVKFKDAQNVYKYLLKNKVVVRNRSNIFLCEGSLRITVGKESENKSLISCLKKYIDR